MSFSVSPIPINTQTSVVFTPECDCTEEDEEELEYGEIGDGALEASFLRCFVFHPAPSKYIHGGGHKNLKRMSTRIL